MKRFVSVFLVVLLAFSTSFALAEGMDFASMSDDALRALVDAARNELAKRELTAAENTVLFEQNGVKVYLTGAYDLSYDNAYLSLEAVVVNDSDKKVNVSVDTACINGWDVYGSGIGDISAGKKKKAST